MIDSLHYSLNRRPIEMPECLPGLHPRLRWNRRKRDVEMRLRQNYIRLRNYRQFKRKIMEMIQKENFIDDPFPLDDRSRTKRNAIYHRNHRRTQKRPHNANHKWQAIAPAILRFRRAAIPDDFPNVDYQFARLIRDDYRREQRNRYEEQQRAYNKYFEKIKQKHRNYISNLLRASHTPVNRVREGDLTHFDNDESAYQKDEEYLLPAKDPFDEINAYASMPIPLPNINENRNMYSKKEMPDGIINNTFVGRGREQALIDKNKNHLTLEITNEYFGFTPAKQGQKNATHILELLRSQIVRRRKRNVDSAVETKSDDREDKQEKHDSEQPQRDEEIDAENPKKARPKEPCEVSGKMNFVFCLLIKYLFSFSQPIQMRPYLRIDILREGRDPSFEFSSGTIVRATCAKEYRLNLQNPNGTAKCVRGRWKPQKPECKVIPCSIASTEHGTYVAIVKNPNDENGKVTTHPLNAFDEVQSGESVQFSCEDGYSVQGPKQLKCVESSWDVPGLPECVPAPCSLPTIDNAAYQVNILFASRTVPPYP